MAMLFKDAKVGDEVAVFGRSNPATITKATITAVTSTQVTVNGTKYTRAKGAEICAASCYSKLTIEPWTAAIEGRIAKAAEEALRAERKAAATSALARATARITNRFGSLNDEQIAAIMDLAVQLDTTITIILSGDQ